jgi:hypothetical protein
MKRRITRISVETEREVIVGGGLVSGPWCTECGKPVVLIVQKDKLQTQTEVCATKPDNRHLVEVVEGRILICPNSQRD